MRILLIVITVLLFSGCKKKITTIPEPVKSDAAEMMTHREVSPAEEESLKKEMVLEKIQKLRDSKYAAEKSSPGITASAASSPSLYRPVSAPVKAASHDDNEEFAYYQTYLKKVPNPTRKPWIVDNRLYLRAVDLHGKPLFGDTVTITDADGESVFKASIPASGELVVFPAMDLPGQCSLKSCSIKAGSGEPVRLEQVNLSDVIAVSMNKPRTLPSKTVVQIAFVVDATGSMGDEIKRLQDAVYTIHHRLTSISQNVEFQFSITAYRDRGDKYVVNGRDFTSSIDTFQLNLGEISANGGGDTPEDLDSALTYACGSLSWMPNSVKSLFVITDAAPHFENEKNTYLDASRRFREMGAKVSAIGASGLDSTAEYALRQIALLTKGEFIFLNYGETGESSGASTVSDPGKVSHHTGENYTVRNLDDIVVGIIRNDLSGILPEQTIVQSYPAPDEQKEHLDTRCDNLIQQLFASVPAAAGRTIVLAPVEPADSSLTELSRYIWNTALVQIPAFSKGTVIERAAMDKIIQEQAFSVSGAAKDDGFQRVGELLNADYLIFSSLSCLGTSRFCSMRLVECKSGAVVSAARVKL